MVLKCGHDNECYYFHPALIGGMRHRCILCDDPNGNSVHGRKMIIQLNNNKTPEELTELMKQVFAKMGYDTPEKRQQWYEENSKPIAILCTRIEGDFNAD